MKIINWLNVKSSNRSILQSPVAIEIDNSNNKHNLKIKHNDKLDCPLLGNTFTESYYGIPYANDWPNSSSEESDRRDKWTG